MDMILIESRTSALPTTDPALNNIYYDYFNKIYCYERQMQDSNLRGHCP